MQQGGNLLINHDLRKITGCTWGFQTSGLYIDACSNFIMAVLTVSGCRGTASKVATQHITECL
jgi:hypothetical protein